MTSFAFLPPQAIEIFREGRQRREIEIGDLLPSIQKRGVITPIVVERSGGEELGWSYRLIAGERRLTCALQLGIDVPVRFLDELSQSEAKIIELEENLKRSDLIWQDIVRSLKEIHLLYRASAPSWRAGQTAEALGLTEGYISIAFRVAKDLEDQNVAKCGTMREAYNLLLRRDQREAARTIDNVLGGEDNEPPQTSLDFESQAERNGAPAEEGAESREHEDLHSGRIHEPVARPNGVHPGIIQGDFHSWAQEWSGPKFNLIHCDFPYGIGLFGSNGVRTGENRSQMGRDEGESYGDSKEDYERVLEVFLQNFNKFASKSCHLMFWFSNKFEIEKYTREQFAKHVPDLQFSRYPLIWHKSDNAGIAAVPDREFRHVYEMALFGWRGERPIVRLKSDLFSCPTEKSLHTSAKPPQMLRHFFEALVDEHTTLFDPTAGSGYALQAAEALGAKFTLGLEIDPKMVELAQGALKRERAKREAARLVGG